ncbi:MAG: hypothetical protein M0P57_14485 [Syntrophales bacterium]|jgi:hypothetical protein|nr:hypothetical protein [Syntrophales bacterium]MDY0044920.1 hypothetical protein [Syntrophales bacterium]
MYSLGIILSAFFGILLYFIAEKRGVNKIFWMVMGFIFGVFAVPFVFLAKPVDSTRRQKEKKDCADVLTVDGIKVPGENKET